MENPTESMFWSENSSIISTLSMDKNDRRKKKLFFNYDII